MEKEDDLDELVDLDIEPEQAIKAILDDDEAEGEDDETEGSDTES
jgi:hypothetical protein